MPLYEFKCGVCDCSTEVRCSYDKMKTEPPTCCGNTMNNIVGGCNFELKGTGWTPRGVDYIT